jgi:hypothetical protein
MKAERPVTPNPRLAVMAPRTSGGSDRANVARLATSKAASLTETEKANEMPLARISSPTEPSANQRLMPIPGRASNASRSITVGVFMGGRFGMGNCGQPRKESSGHITCSYPHPGKQLLEPMATGVTRPDGEGKNGSAKNNNRGKSFNCTLAFDVDS